MSEIPDRITPRAVDSGAHRRAEQTPPHARRWWRPRTVVAFLLVLLALGAVQLVRSRTILDLGQRCGSIVSGRPGTPTSAAVVHTEIACFVHAYAHCAAASLDTTLNFGDGRTSSTLVVVPGQGAHGTCGLVIQWSTQLAGGGHTSSGQEQCTGLTRQQDMLTFQNCGTLDDVQVPPGP